MPKISINTAPCYHFEFFGFGLLFSGWRIRNDEVVGSIPTSSTILTNLFSIVYSLGFQFVPFLYRRLTEASFSLTFFPVMMGLFVYARHTADCPNRDDRFWRRCRCPQWIRGVIRDRTIRESAQTRSWERAEKTARGMEERAASRDRKAEQRVTIKEAVEAFLEDERSRHLAKTTTRQTKTLLQQQFLAWTAQQGLRFLSELTAPVLAKFRTTWVDAGNNANTSRRKHQRLSGFMWFCVRNEWAEKNPARFLKPIRVKQIPTDYFTREEFKRIVDATYAYGEWQGGRDFHHRAEKLRALILLMRWSGLAIRDAVTLERERLTSNNKLFLYRAKTNVPVYLPLPPDLANLLRALPNSNPRYFFWSGNGDAETVKKGWDRSLRRLFKDVKLRKSDGTLKRCHAHMFRDTFAVELLLAGVPLDQVSLLLGHASIKVTERHYSPFVKARQEQLEASTLRAWAVMESYGDATQQTTLTVNQRPN
jgi:integrase/recombinase XerD